MRCTSCTGEFVAPDEQYYSGTHLEETPIGKFIGGGIILAIGVWMLSIADELAREKPDSPIDQWWLGVGFCVFGGLIIGAGYLQMRWKI